MAINKVILLGNVGKDPDVRYLDNNVAVANFTLATTERGYTAANGTQIPDKTEWHNIVVWRGLAQVVEKYVRKGSPLYVEGKIRTRSYDDSSGNKRYITEIYADNIELLGKKGDGTNDNSIPPPPPPPPSGGVIERSTDVTATSFDESDGGNDLPF